MAADVPPRDDIALDAEAGWFKVATPRTCAVFAEGGTHEAGALAVALAGDGEARNSATVWASSLDGAPLAGSRHVLVGLLTDLRNTGMETEERPAGSSSLSGGPATLVRKWGGLPYLVRRGVARIGLEAAPGAWKAWALSQGGRRLAEVPVERTDDGRLAFTADTGAVPGAATLFWELAR